MGLSLVTPPAEEPITLAEAKLHARIGAEITHDDDLVVSLVEAARHECESISNRALLPQTWRCTRRAFPPGETPLELPKPPLRSVASIKYIDELGVLQTMDPAGYVVDVDGDDGVVGHVRPVYAGSWPAARDEPNAVRVTFEAGYADPQAVPPELRRGMLEVVSSSYEQRESYISGTIIARVPDPARDAFQDKAVLWREW